jgi:hypothetical protein
MKNIITALLFTICFSLNYVTAQTAEKKPSPQWWLNSSFADSADQYLFHVEGQYSYTKMTGSIAGEMQSGMIKTAVRKSVFTNHIDYFIDKSDQEIKSLGMSLNTASDAFTEYLDVDITPLLYGEAGYIWERDNTLYIQNRNSFYAGLGLNHVINQQHYLKILFAAGSVNQDYTIPVDNINVVKGVHTVYYIRQQYKFVTGPIFSIMDEAYYLNYLDSSNRYRMGLMLNLYIAVVRPVSIVLGYNYKFDKENELLGAIATNTTQTIGVQISL